MNGIPSPVVAAEEVFYPSGDGQPMAETGIHVLLMLWLIGALRHHFRHRSDYYIIGNIFLFYEEKNPDARRSPDVMLVKGVSTAPPERESFKVWEEKAVPNLVIELTSKGTADEDQGPKKELYQRLGVREYLLFDPLGEYLTRPLVAYRLIGGQYEELQPAVDGGVLSLETNLRFVPEGQNLALIDFASGQRLLSPEEMGETLAHVTQERDEVTRQRDHERRQREEATRQRDDAARQRDELLRQQNEALQRMKEMHEEMESLKAELARVRPPSPPQSGGEQA
jgi:Uma2 family endonuclease